MPIITDAITTQNPRKVAVANFSHLSGSRSVQTLTDLYSKPSVYIDAVGQEWYVIDEDAVYRLVDLSNKTNSLGWVNVNRLLKVNGASAINNNIEVSTLPINFDGSLPTITGLTHDKELNVHDGVNNIFYAHNFVSTTDGSDYFITSVSSGWLNTRKPGGVLKVSGDCTSFIKVFDLTTYGIYASPTMYLVGTYTENDYTNGVFEFDEPGKEGIWISLSGEPGTWQRSTSWNTLYQSISWRKSNISENEARRRSGDIYSIAKGKNNYIAANAWGGGLFWSSDGINWNTSTINSSLDKSKFASEEQYNTYQGQCNGAFSSVAYGNGIHVAGNKQSITNTTFFDRFGLFWSVDGKTWEQSHINFPGAKINSIVYHGGVFVAVGNGYTKTDENGHPTDNSVFTSGAYVSTDGKKWKFYPIYESDERNYNTDGLFNVTYVENAQSFFATDFDGDINNDLDKGGIWRSYDGTAWFRITDIKRGWGSICSIASKNTAIITDDTGKINVTTAVKRQIAFKTETNNTDNNILDDIDKPLVSPVIVGQWTISPSTPAGININDKHIELEVGYSAHWTGNWTWTSDENKKNPTRCVSFGKNITVPSESTNTKIDLSLTSESAEREVVLYAPQNGLVIDSNIEKIIIGTGEDSTKDSISVKFLNRYYFGYSESETITADQILNSLEVTGLTDTKEFEIDNVNTVNNSYVYYCYPASLGDLTNIIYNNGQSVLDAFEKSTINITNLAGTAITMNVYRSSNAGVYYNTSKLQFS